MNVAKILGDHFLLLQRNDDAIKNYHLALMMADEVNDFAPHISEITGKVQNNTGLALKAKGFLEAAMASFSKSLVSQLLAKNNNIDTALTINNLGSCHFDLGQYEAALNLFKRCLNIYKEIKQTETEFDREIGKVHNNVALCYMEIGRYPEALENFHKYLDLMGKEGRDLPRVLNNIANCYSRMDRIPKGAFINHMDFKNGPESVLSIFCYSKRFVLNMVQNRYSKVHGL